MIAFIITVIIIILYFICIAPSRSSKERLKSLPSFFAHRGLHDADAPENSMSAFLSAARAGYGIEFDVRLTADKQAVVMHDASTARLCGRKLPIAKASASELSSLRLPNGEAIPLLSEVIKELNPHGTALLIELKHCRFPARLCKAVYREICRYSGPVLIQAFDPISLLWFRIHQPNILRGQLIGSSKPGAAKLLLFPHTLMLTNFLTKPDFISCGTLNLHSPSFLLCKKLFGCPSAVWTVQHQTQADQYHRQHEICIFEAFLPYKINFPYTSSQDSS